MKKAFLLLLCGTLAFCACRKDPTGTPEIPESELTGTTVDVSILDGARFRKLFVLNEGQKGANNASLDILRLSDGQYITGVFKKVNPQAGALGDVGNDIVVAGDEVWIVVNNSGIVEVISAEDEKEIAAIKVPTPRQIACDDRYAYVTSWAGAYANYENYVLSDYKNIKGQVYRINLKTKKVEGSVEVGYQPEGIALQDGSLYVANSGGISSQVPPDYAYDNRLTVIDTKTFTETGVIEVAPNLKDVFASPDGSLFVTTLGNYSDVHSGMYRVKNNLLTGRVEEGGDIGCNVSAATMDSDGIFWAIGNDTEFDWGAAHAWYLWNFNSLTSAAVSYLPDYKFSEAVPYGIFEDGGALFVADAGDYFNPGTLSLYVSGKKIWTVSAGVCPGHFAIW